MSVALIQGLTMKIESRSYIDAMHGILTHKGFITCSKHMLAGMTVRAFCFVANRRLTSESSTAYNWLAENFLAADFIGVTSSQQAGYTFDATFPLYRGMAITRIKESIDRGMGAVIWKEGFVVVTGYDDERALLYYTDGVHEGDLPLPFEDFGADQTAYWYYQVFEDQVDLDWTSVYRESLLQAIYKWEKHDLMLPESEYGCGKEAYDVIIQALRIGEFDREGARFTFECYASAKKDLAAYTMELMRIWPQLSEAANRYAELASIFKRINDIYSNHCSSTDQESIQLPIIITWLKEAQETEDKAIQSFKMLLGETINNRAHTIELR